MKLERRHFLSAVGATGVLLTARPSRAASIADWVAGAGMMSRFAAAGIPQRSLVISSGSMLPTLLPQDAVLTDLRGAGKLPDRGEIVAFTSKNGAVYAKRVIGLPGDRIAFQNRRLILNGQTVAWKEAGTVTFDTDRGKKTLSLLEEALPDHPPYRIGLQPPTADRSPLLDTLPEITVAPDHIHVLGDNRDNALDSRLPEQIPPIAAADVIGRVVYRLWPNSGWLVPPDSVPGLPSE